MTTPRHLMITALDVAPDRPLMQGELSLALAGAELIDLLNDGSIGLDGDRIVPVPGDRAAAMGDRLLGEAAAALVRQAPYESVEEWLWRRGRGLSATYAAALEADGQLSRSRRRSRRVFSRAGQGQVVVVDSPDRHVAADRWASGEPVLAALASAVGIRGDGYGDDRSDGFDGVADDAVVAVLAAVNDALMELEAVRQRRAIEDAAFDNIWRGP